MDFLDMIEKQSSVKPKPWMKRKTLKLVTSEGHVEAPPSGEVVDMTSGEEEAPTEWDQPVLSPEDPPPSKDNWAMIDEVVDACIASGLYGIDLETTGLDTRVFPNQDGHLETVAKIVGICLTPDGERGYYIPVRHVVDKGLGQIEPSPFNAPMSKVRVAMERLTSSQSVAIFQNAKYDQELLQFNGGTPWGEWDTIKLWEDTLILAYLENTRRKRKGLKFLSDLLLSMEMIELYELWGHDKSKANFEYNFATRPLDDPATIQYAAGDAICTYELFKYLHPKVVTGDNQSQANTYSIEKAGMVGCRWMERCRVHTDRAKVAELIAITQQQYMDSTKEVYETASKVLGRDIAPLYYYKLLEELQKDNPTLEVCDPKPGQAPTMLLLDRIDECMNRMKKGVAGPGDSALIHEKAKRRGIDTGNVDEEDKPILLAATFDLKSQKQLGIMLDEMGVPLPRTKKSGQIATSALAIDGALEEVGDRFPWIGVIKRFRNLEKGLSTYLYSLWRDAHPSDHTIRINFNGFKGDTGRYTVRGSKNPERDGYSGFPFHGTPNTYDKSRPEGLRRIRECLSARPGKMLLAIDFSGEELRIVTNLSGEPKWYNEFFRCSSCGLEFDRGDGKSTPEAPPTFCPKCGSDKIGDIHTLTALSVYGEDAINRPDWKILRNNAKCVHPATIIGTPEGMTPLGMSFTYGQPDTFKEENGSVWDGSHHVPVKETYNGGIKPLFHVVTRRGIVTCSETHGFKTADGKVLSIQNGLREGTLLKEAAFNPELGRGEWVQIPHRPFENLPEVQITATADLAYLAGSITGDGAKHGTNSIGISHGAVGKVDLTGTSYQQWQDILVQACSEAGFRPIRHAQSVYLGSCHVMRFLAALNLVEGVEGGKVLRVPWWVLAAGREGVLHFLGGLFDTDGTVNKRDAALSWTTKDAVFAGQVAALIHGLGALPYMEPCWNKKYQRWYYRVRVRASDAALIARHMKHPGMRDRIRRTRKGWEKPNSIVKVIPAGDGPCVDLHLDTEEHLYWTNGVLTHNSVNFALCYGGGGQAVVKAVSCDENEGWRIKRTFDRDYGTLKQWWDIKAAQVKSFAYVTTGFGRHCAIPDINMPKRDPATGRDNRGFIAKALRNAVNAPVQGTGADIIKIATAMIYKHVKKQGWFGKVLMIGTIHDELVFEIDLDIVEQAINEISEIMTRNQLILRKNWLVPFTVDVEGGPDWTVPWNITEMQHGKKEWPDELKPYFKAQPSESDGGGDPPVDPEDGAEPESEPERESTPKSEAEAEAEGNAEAKEETPESDPEEPPPTPESAVRDSQKVSPRTYDVTPGGIFIYTVKELTVEAMLHLAKAIIRTKGLGTQKLRLQDVGGNPLDWTDDEVYVSEVQFKVLMENYEAYGN